MKREARRAKRAAPDGWVYVLATDAMPGTMVVGVTQRVPAQRMRDIIWRLLERGLTCSACEIWSARSPDRMAHAAAVCAALADIGTGMPGQFKLDMDRAKAAIREVCGTEPGLASLAD